MTVSVVIVTYNSQKYLPYLFESLEKQTIFNDLEIIVVDNASADDTIEFLKPKKIFLIQNKLNQGFAKANNQGFAKASGEFILCLNQDVILEPDYIERLVGFLLENRKAGAVAGKILKWDFKNKIKTRLVDTLGFKIFKSHQVVDQTTLDFGFELNKEVFGVCAAAAMYRRESLEKIFKISGHFFDPDFSSYKEDVDLAFRFRHAGFKSFIVSQARCYHDRWATGNQKNGLMDKIESRKSRPSLINRWSYRNHLTVLVKNEFLANLFWYLPNIMFFEVRRILFYLLFEPKTVLGLFDFLKSFTLTLAKRRAIFKKTTLQPTDISGWYV